MPKTTYTLSSKPNSLGECQINMRTHVYRSHYLRLKSNIWVDARRWGKKNVITIPLIEGEEQASLLEKKNTLRRLTIFVEDAINAVKDKKIIDKEWGIKIVKEFYNPPKHEEQPRELTLFEVADLFLSVRKMSDLRKKNFRVLIRCLHRFELYLQKKSKKGFTKLSFAALSAETLRDFEDFLGMEPDIFKEYQEIYKTYPYSSRLVPLTPPRNRPPILDKKGNIVPKGMPKSRGQNAISDLMTRFRTFIRWAKDTKYTSTNPFEHYKVGDAVYGTPIYISTEEKKKLLQADFSDDKDLETQRDIFIFQCSIGCRVSNLYSMTRKNIINGAIEYIARKTRDDLPFTVRVPLNNTAIAIMKKYCDPDRTSLFPFKTQQHYNRKIKEAFKRAGLDRTVTIIDQKTRLEVQKPLFEVASSHMARRTFTGNIYKQVKDQNLVSAVTGHKIGSKAFARYRDVDDDMKRDMVNLLD